MRVRDEHRILDAIRASGLAPEIFRVVEERMLDGHMTYGEWRLDDGRIYTREAREEVADIAPYGSAAFLNEEVGPAAWQSAVNDIEHLYGLFTPRPRRPVRR